MSFINARNKRGVIPPVSGHPKPKHKPESMASNIFFEVFNVS